MTEAARRFEDLIVWQKAHQFVLAVYKLNTAFPKHELYALGSQLRRAAISIPGNIAEGFKRRGKADKGRFLNIVQGSLEESRYYLLLAQDLGYCDSTGLLAQAEEVGKLLGSYARKILSSLS